MTEVTDALYNMALAAGKLVTATDGMEELREQRQATLNAVSAAEVALRAASPADATPDEDAWKRVGIIAGLKGLAAAQRQKRGDPLTYGSPDPEIEATIEYLDRLAPTPREPDDAMIDECDHGHKFAKLPDHPMKDGNARCPHCMVQGLAASPRSDVLREALELLVSTCEQDEKDGYQSGLRTFVLDIGRKALASAGKQSSDGGVSDAPR